MLVYPKGRISQLPLWGCILPRLSLCEDAFYLGLHFGPTFYPVIPFTSVHFIPQLNLWHTFYVEAPCAGVQFTQNSVCLRAFYPEAPSGEHIPRISVYGTVLHFSQPLNLPGYILPGEDE